MAPHILVIMPGLFLPSCRSRQLPMASILRVDQAQVTMDGIWCASHRKAAPFKEPFQVMMRERANPVVVLEADVFDLFQGRRVRVKQNVIFRSLAVQFEVITPRQSQISEKLIERDAWHLNSAAEVTAPGDSGVPGRLAREELKLDRAGLASNSVREWSHVCYLIELEVLF